LVEVRGLTFTVEPSRLSTDEINHLNHAYLTCDIEVEMSKPAGEKRYRIGRYGAGSLWCLSTPSDLFILFNNMMIAKRSRSKAADWLSLHSAWKVSAAGHSELCVQYNGGEGVFVSLSGGNQ
jgi:hypothetical protein